MADTNKILKLWTGTEASGSMSRNASCVLGELILRPSGDLKYTYSDSKLHDGLSKADSCFKLDANKCDYFQSRKIKKYTNE